MAPLSSFLITDVGMEYTLAQERWGSRDWAFRIVSRNARPRPVSGEPPVPFAFGLTPQGSSAYGGTGGFEVTFVDEVVTADGSSPQTHEATRDILAHPPEDFSILPCDNHLDLVAEEFAAILSPFFFSDDQNTFFVEPSLEEITTEEWEDWVIPVAKPDPTRYGSEWFKAIPLEPAVPVRVLPPSIDAGVVIDPLARFGFRERADWLTNKATAVQIGKTLVGGPASAGVVVGAGAAAATNPMAAATVAAGVVAVGASGLNMAHLERLQGLNR
jgi:hypothetical protein